jgi:phage gpG-like protein
MAMMLTCEAFGEQTLSREIVRFKDRGMDMRPAFRKIHESFIGVEGYQFRTEGGLSGGWAPLAPSTVEAKAKAGLDPRILHATHRLRDSLTTFEGEDHIYEARPDEMKVGSETPYGIFHQSTAPRTKLPRRPPVEIKETTKRRWIKYLQAYLMGVPE